MSDDRGTINVTRLCERLGYSRQAFYQTRRARAQQAFDEAFVLSAVREQRHCHPRMGARKLYHLLGPVLQGAGIQLGRDRFFVLLKRHGLLVPHRRRGARTTDSQHAFRLYPDLLADAANTPTEPHQAWVCDLTYIDTAEGFQYLALVTDAYSRQIVGYDLSRSLCVEGSLRALEQAGRQLPKGHHGTIHHSDRGVQYCCHTYRDRLHQLGCRVSTTQTGSPYDNAKAERVNGILKHEYGLRYRFANSKQAATVVRQAIELYNYHRPHLALNYATPASIHQRAG